MKKLSYIVALTAALAGAGLLAVPSAQAAAVCVDSVTAGGWVPDGGADEFANFGLNADIDFSTGELTGELNFVDTDMDCHVVGQEVLSYTVDGDCRTIVYAVTQLLFSVPQEETFEATVTVCDGGEGVNAAPDFFSIEVNEVSNPEEPVLIETCSVSGDLAGGDVQVHPAHGNCED
jgi:hypothetical protein